MRDELDKEEKYLKETEGEQTKARSLKPPQTCIGTGKQRTLRGRRNGGDNGTYIYRFSTEFPIPTSRVCYLGWAWWMFLAHLDHDLGSNFHF